MGWESSSFGLLDDSNDSWKDLRDLDCSTLMNTMNAPLTSRIETLKKTISTLGSEALDKFNEGDTYAYLELSHTLLQKGSELRIVEAVLKNLIKTGLEATKKGVQEQVNRMARNPSNSTDPVRNLRHQWEMAAYCDCLETL